jgi:acyl-CoA synthetase (AMP-forming)/AMP-acid ligase II
VSGWSVAGVVRARAAADPLEPLFIGAAGTLTARDFDERTSRIGQALLGAGCAAGDRVGFVGRNELAWYELLFGAAKAGVVAVGLSWRSSPAELAAIASDAGVRVIAAGRAFDDAAIRAAPEGALVVRSTEWDAWRDAGPPEDPGHVATPTEAALQLYTSGTTAAAKGVILSQGAIAASLPAAARWHLEEGANALVNLPLAHFGGTGWPLWALALGARCTVHPEVDAETAVAAFRNDVTTSLAVPQILRLLCDEADRTGGGPFTALQCLGYGSAPITEDLLLRTMRTFDCALVQTYGMTETCGVLTQLGPDEHDPNGPRRHLLRSAGRPVPGVEVWIGNPPHKAPVAEVGNVWVRAPWLMRGYWHRPDATAAVLTADGWLSTGDMGFVDADGYLYLTDRSTDMIITGGENVYPAEVEAVLARHPAVADVAVLGIPDERWGESVVAVVVPTAGTVLGAGELVAFARSNLAHFKCPARVATTSALPRNPTGKVLRRELRQLFTSGTSSDQAG